MFLPTTISDPQVETAFMDFGRVHFVRAGTYSNEFAGMKITPHNGKTALPYEIIFQGCDRVFKVMWPEKVVDCKRCGTTQQLCNVCDEQKAGNNRPPPMVKARVRFPGRMKPIGLSVNPGNQMGISLEPPTQS